MKKILLPIILLFLFITPFLSAIEFDMQESFGREGVLTAKLSGQFVDPPLRENILFYRGHVKIAVDPYVTKIGDNYYIYASLAGKEPKNYSISIEDISYMKGSQKITEDLTKNFTISEEYAEFIVNPGFVSTKNDFSITLENLQDESLDILMSIETVEGEEGGILNYEEEVEHELSINPGQEKISFELGYLNGPTSKLITFSSENLNYTIPISLYIDEQAEQMKTFAFDIWPEEIDITVPTFDNITKLIYIYNTGTGLLTDIKLKISDSLKPYVTISEDRFGQIVPNSNANLEMNIVSGSEKSIGGKLEVSTEQGLTKDVRVSIKFEQGYELSEEERAPQISSDENCEVNGKICLDDEICEGEEIPSKNGICCIGGLCKKKPSGSSLKWIGWGLLAVLILGGVWFYFKKYKGVKKPVDLLRFTRKRQ